MFCTICKEPNVHFPYDENQTKVLKNEFKLMRKYIEEYDELFPNEKRELINHYSNVMYDTSDICSIVNEITEAGHDMLMTLPTKMETFSYLAYPNGIGFYENCKGVHYLVATREELNLESKLYSREEIMNMIKANQIFPIYSFTRELYRPCDDSEPINDVPTLKNFGVDVSSYPEFELFEIHFDDSACVYENHLLENTDSYKFGLDIGVSDYLDRLIKYADTHSNFDDERNYVRKIKEYKKENFKRKF